MHAYSCNDLMPDKVRHVRQQARMYQVGYYSNMRQLPSWLLQQWTLGLLRFTQSFNTHVDSKQTNLADGYPSFALVVPGCYVVDMKAP